MKKRQLGRNDPEITECGLGCWQLGGGWGNPWDNEIARNILCAAYESGIRFFDTADCYGDGESEKSIGAFITETEKTDIFVATKLGRCGGLYPDNYTEEGLLAATRASIERLGADKLQLTQLHCVPPEVLEDGKIFDMLRRQRDNGLIDGFGASVESVEEGLICLDQEGLVSLQVIFNIFRQKPLKELLPKAYEKGVGIIVRLPLASGLLSGKFNKSTTFRETDHRNFNRDGKRFNVGETFAGIPFEKGVELADKMKQFVPEGISMSQMALRWILDHKEVSVVIPGASSPQQATANAGISDLAPLSAELHNTLSDFYENEVREFIRGPY